MVGCRVLSKSPLFPFVLSITTHNPRFLYLRSFTRRTVRMASSSDTPAAAAAAGVPEATTSSSPASAIDLLTLCHRLKTTKRAGWVRRGVEDPESVADHMYRMCVMALVAPDIPGVDRDRCVKMAIVHDIAEVPGYGLRRDEPIGRLCSGMARVSWIYRASAGAIVGDITPADGVPKLEKSRREREALDHMCKLLGGGSRAKEIGELWMEYEENASLEAKIVKDFDKVEMILQALEYENEQEMDLDEFFQSTAGKFQTDVGKAWASEIVSRRKRDQSL